MDSKAVSAPLLDEAYTMDLASGRILGVPLAVWSSKSFVARWETGAGGIEADLKGAANHRLQGRIVNKLDVPLTDCELLYSGWVYSLGNIALGQSVDVEHTVPVTARTFLTKQHVRMDSSEEITPYDRAGFDVGRIVEMMMFHAAAGGESYAGLLDRQQRFTDLSDQLSFDRAILVCHGPAGAELQIDGQPVPKTEYGSPDDGISLLDAGEAARLTREFEVIETRDLTKKYDELFAVKSLSIKLDKGDVFGFIGPNGAGKTTTMRMLATLLNPTWAKRTFADIRSTRSRRRFGG